MRRSSLGAIQRKRAPIYTLSNTLLVRVLECLPIPSLINATLSSRRLYDVITAAENDTTLWSRFPGGREQYKERVKLVRDFQLQPTKITFDVGVYGSPDSGKTTLLRTLKETIADGSIPRSPVLGSPVALSPRVFKYVRLDNSLVVRLSLCKVDPSLLTKGHTRTAFRGFHVALVLYNCNDVFSLLEHAKAVMKDINRYATPTDTPIYNIYTVPLQTQLLLVGNNFGRIGPDSSNNTNTDADSNADNNVDHKGDPIIKDTVIEPTSSSSSSSSSPSPSASPSPDPFPADLERARTLAPLCDQVAWAGNVELDVKDSENVTKLMRAIAVNCYYKLEAADTDQQRAKALMQGETFKSPDISRRTRRKSVWDAPPGRDDKCAIM